MGRSPSEPLSRRKTFGLPRHSMIWSRLGFIRSHGREKSTSMPSASRLKASMTLNNRNDLPSAISHLVMHKVDRPHRVDRLRHRQRLWLHSVHTLLRLDPQVQPQLSVNSIHAFVSPERAPVPLVLRQTQQPLSDPDVLSAELRLIAISVLTH